MRSRRNSLLFQLHLYGHPFSVFGIIRKREHFELESVTPKTVVVSCLSVCAGRKRGKYQKVHRTFRTYSHSRIESTAQFNWFVFLPSQDCFSSLVVHSFVLFSISLNTARSVLRLDLFPSIHRSLLPNLVLLLSFDAINTHSSLPNVSSLYYVSLTPLSFRISSEYPD